MAIDYINVGAVANDGTGDDLRDAFIKVNDNFNLLYSTTAAAVEGTNLGAAGQPVFVQKNINVLEYRKIDAQGALKLTVAADGELTLKFNPTNTVSFNNQSISDVNNIAAATFSGVLTGNVIGLMRGPGAASLNALVNPTQLGRTINTFDYGYIIPTFTNPIAYLLGEIGTDMGTFASPNLISIDAGTI